MRAGSWFKPPTGKCSAKRGQAKADDLNGSNEIGFRVVSDLDPRPASAAPAGAADDTDEQRIEDLIDGNHILANECVLDGFGHIGVRSVKNPKHFYMARARGPGLVRRADILEFNENSEPVDQQGRAM